jgi:flagellar biosynthesis chaperone FliJ
MDGNSRPLSSLEKLLQIEQLRLDSEEKKLNKTQEEYRQACNKRNERIGIIDNLKGRKGELYQYLLKDEVMVSPNRLVRCHDERFWLNYDLEMHEYYLTQEEESVAETREAYEHARISWMRQKNKTEKLKDIYRDRSVREQLRSEELADESAYDDRRAVGIQVCG